LQPEQYVLVTSLPLSPADKAKIIVALEPYLRATEDVIGAEDLNNLLRKYRDVESQHFKLWMSSTNVLQRVLHNATRVQTDFDLERIRRAMPLYVQITNYSRALQIIERHKVIIISGVPGIGKSTLADMLLFAHLGAGYEPIVIKGDVKEAKDVFRENKRQIFYFDDFLGETFLGNRFDFLGKREDL
jgi:UDP-N-acetylmuramate-alanine ligase